MPCLKVNQAASFPSLVSPVFISEFTIKAESFPQPKLPDSLQKYASTFVFLSPHLDAFFVPLLHRLVEVASDAQVNGFLQSVPGLPLLSLMLVVTLTLRLFNFANKKPLICRQLIIENSLPLDLVPVVTLAPLV